MKDLEQSLEQPCATSAIKKVKNGRKKGWDCFVRLKTHWVNIKLNIIMLKINKCNKISIYIYL